MHRALEPMKFVPRTSREVTGEKRPRTFLDKVLEALPVVLITALVGFIFGVTSGVANDIAQGDLNWRNWEKQHEIEFATKACWDKIGLLRDLTTTYQDYILFDSQMELEQRYRIMRLAMRMSFPDKTINFGSLGISITEQPSLDQFRQLADRVSKLETVVALVGIYFGPKVEREAEQFIHQVRNAPVTSPDPQPLIEQLKKLDPSNQSTFMAGLMAAIKPYSTIPPELNTTSAPFSLLVRDMRNSVEEDRATARPHG